MRNIPMSRTDLAIDAVGKSTRADDWGQDVELCLSSEECYTPKSLFPQDEPQRIRSEAEAATAPALLPAPIPIRQPCPQSLLDPLKRARSHFTDSNRVRAFSIEHTSQELEALSRTVFEGGAVSRDDLDRLRVLLHAQVQAIRNHEYIAVYLQSQQSDCRAAFGFVPTPPNGCCRQLYEPPLAPPDVSSQLHSMLERCLARKLKLPAKVRRLLPETCLPNSSPESCARVLVGSMIGLSVGASIALPVAVMVLSPGLGKGFVVVGVAVSLFGIFLAAMARMEGSQVFLMTAAYAAILTLFVGTSRHAAAF